MSTTDEERFESTLAVVEKVVDVLAGHGIEAIVIGGVALAFHAYPRDTQDFDLAVAVSPARLRSVAEDLRRKGWEVEVRHPDASDPLGGVIDIRANDADLVQIVNFNNEPAGGFPRLVKDGLASAIPFEKDGSLRIVSLPMLIAFKLYAGGRKSQIDVLELLDRNPQLDLKELRALCRSLRLERQLDDVLKPGEES